MEDVGLSLSVNYFKYIYEDFLIGLNNHTTAHGMTDPGWKIYNESFETYGLECGDNIITKDRMGIMFMYGL